MGCVGDGGGVGGTGGSVGWRAGGWGRARARRGRRRKGRRRGGNILYGSGLWENKKGMERIEWKRAGSFDERLPDNQVFSDSVYIFPPSLISSNH